LATHRLEDPLKEPLTAPAGRRSEANPRPLAVRCGAFGDMVLFTAMIRELHAQFRRPVDILTSGPWSEPLLRANGCAAM